MFNILCLKAEGGQGLGFPQRSCSKGSGHLFLDEFRQLSNP